MQMVRPVCGGGTRKEKSRNEYKKKKKKGYKWIEKKTKINNSHLI